MAPDSATTVVSLWTFLSIFYKHYALSYKLYAYGLQPKANTNFRVVLAEGLTCSHSEHRS